MEQKSQLTVTMFIKVMDISLHISCYPTTKRKEKEIYSAQSNVNHLFIPRNAPTPLDHL